MSNGSSGEMGVSDTIDTSAHADNLEDMSSVNSESSAREELYIARAVEKDGFDVEIVGVDTESKFQTACVNRSHVGRKHTINTFSSYEDAVDSATQDTTDQLFFSTKFSPSFIIYYKTPFDEIYKVSVNTRIKRRRMNVKKEHENFLENLWRQTHTSSQHNGVSDITETHSIKAKFEPKEDMTNGSLRLEDSEISFAGAENVDVPRTDSDVDQILKSVVNKVSETVSTRVGPSSLCWNKTYVSNVLEDNEGDKVYVKVPIQGREVVFPFKISYNTEAPIWDIIEQAGGDLMDVRGMDAYVRYRWPIAGSYDDSYMDYSKSYDVVEQYRIDGRVRSTKLFEDDRCPITPVSIDTNYEWSLGVLERDSEDNEKEESLLSSIRSNWI